MGASQSSPPEDNNSASGTTNSEANNIETNLTQNEQSFSRIRDGIFESIHSFWLKGEFTDFVAIVGKDEVKCHSFILCVCSSYISRLLKSRDVKTNETKVHFNSFSKKTFETILEALYTGKDVITPDNIIDVWHASHELEINVLLQECEDHALKYLTILNFAELHKHAKLLGSAKVSEATLELMQKNFESFKECSEFLELNFEDFLKIVDSQDLIVSSEDIVIDAILKWVKYVPEMYVWLEKLFSASRLSLVSTDCLALLMQCKLVQNHEKVKAAVDKAILYQLKVNVRHGQWPQTAVHRNNSELQNVVVAGGADGSISVLSFLHQNQCCEIKPSAAFTCCYIFMTVFDNTIYALASQQSHCTVPPIALMNANNTLYNKKVQEITNNQVNILSKLYVLNEQKWQEVTAVPGAAHILVPHGESIYFFQPVTKKVLKLDFPFKGKATQSLDDVPSARPIVSCVPVERNILIFSLKPESREEETTVHCLNTVTKTWSRMNNLRGPAQLVSFKDDEGTYILQKNGAVSRIIDTHGGKVDFKSIDMFWHGQWNVTGCVSLGRTLFICRKVDSARDENQPSFDKLSIPGMFDTMKYSDNSFDFFLPAILQKNIIQN